MDFNNIFFDKTQTWMSVAFREIAKFLVYIHSRHLTFEFECYDLTNCFRLNLLGLAKSYG